MIKFQRRPTFLFKRYLTLFKVQLSDFDVSIAAIMYLWNEYQLDIHLLMTFASSLGLGLNTRT